MSGLQFVSLFTGVGGFDLGFEQAGITCVGQAEIEPNCLKLLGAKWPEVKRYVDVKKVAKLSTDLICGGFPCQDVSVAGKRKGLAGERSGLWFEFHRIIKRNLPRWVVIENVPGLLSSNAGRDFAAIFHGLVKLGYGVSWRVLDSQYFGVAQRRRRVFIVASLGNGSSAEVLFEREGLQGDTPTRKEAGQVSATLFASGAGASRPAGTGSELDFLIAPTLSTSLGHHGWSIGDQDFGLLQPVAATLKSGGKGNVPSSNGDNVIGFTPRRTSLNPLDDLSPTQNAGMGGHGGGGVSGSFGVRRLTPVECERLQGFPDGWTEGFADSVRYRMMGNAVTVPVLRWIGQRIMTLET